MIGYILILEFPKKKQYGQWKKSNSLIVGVVSFGIQNQ